MKYTKTERLNIGKQIYERKLNRFDAAIKYEIDPYTARDYMRYYKSTIKDTLVTKKAFKNNKVWLFWVERIILWKYT